MGRSPLRVVCFSHRETLVGRLRDTVAGFKRHGINVEVAKLGHTQGADLTICWGVRMRHHLLAGRRSLVVERGYVGDRFYWTSMGFDGLNGYAKFYNEDATAERWERRFSRHMNFARHKPKDGPVLILGQVPSDCSLRHVDYYQWLRDTAAALTKAGHRVLFRPHPLSKGVTIPGVQDAKEPELLGAIENVSYVVAFNSNGLVDCVLHGVPAVSCDLGSMAYAVTGKNPLVRPRLPDRSKWAHRLAYCQWSPEEIANGDAWDHLKKGMEDDNAPGYRAPRPVQPSYSVPRAGSVPQLSRRARTIR